MFDTIRTWARMVKLSHTVFALPFAFSGATLAAAEVGITWPQVGWIVLAMFGARNAAMGFNRLVDQDVDAENPRTAGRELPRGLLSRGSVWAVTGALTALFILAVVKLGLTLLAIPALLIIFGYSYTKRFTWASHLVLGLAIGIAPVGGWLAVTRSISVVPCILCVAVLSWVAGFDVIYSCQDVEFDRGAGLRSIPARFGVPRSLVLARVLHVVAITALASIFFFTQLHPIYWLG